MRFAKNSHIHPKPRPNPTWKPKVIIEKPHMTIPKPQPPTAHAPRPWPTVAHHHRQTPNTATHGKVLCAWASPEVTSCSWMENLTAVNGADLPRGGGTFIQKRERAHRARKTMFLFGCGVLSLFYWFFGYWGWERSGRFWVTGLLRVVEVGGGFGKFVFEIRIGLVLVWEMIFFQYLSLVINFFL